MKLVSGLYEQLVTRELWGLLNDPEWVADLQSLGEDASRDLLARHAFEAIYRALGGIHGEKRVEHQVALVNRLLDMLTGQTPDEVDRDDDALPQVLLSLMTRSQAGLGKGTLERPGIPLRHGHQEGEAARHPGRGVRERHAPM